MKNLKRNSIILLAILIVILIVLWVFKNQIEPVNELVKQSFHRWGTIRAIDMTVSDLLGLFLVLTIFNLIFQPFKKS